MRVTWTLDGEGYLGVALPEMKKVLPQEAAEKGLIPGYYFKVVDPVALVCHYMRWDTVTLWEGRLRH